MCPSALRRARSELVSCSAPFAGLLASIDRRELVRNEKWVIARVASFALLHMAVMGLLRYDCLVCAEASVVPVAPGAAGGSALGSPDE